MEVFDFSKMDEIAAAHVDDLRHLFEAAIQLIERIGEQGALAELASMAPLVAAEMRPRWEAIGQLIANQLRDARGETSTKSEPLHTTLRPKG